MGRGSHGGVRHLALLALALGGCGWNWDDGLVPADGGTTDASMCVDGHRTLTLSVSASDDDGEIAGVPNNNNVFPAGEDPTGALPRGLYAGIWNDGSSWVHLRFELPETLDSVANLTGAHLELYGVGYNGESVNTESKRFLNILLEDSVDTARVATGTDNPNPTNGKRQALDDQARWTFTELSDFKVNDWNGTPSLTPLLHALITKYGAVDKNAHVTFWMTNLELPVTDHVEFGFQDRAANDGNSAKLVLQFANCP